MPGLTITAVGQDRPGIVAAVTKVLFDLGCNLADCSMTRLSSQFAMILLVEAPVDVGRDVLHEALKDPARALNLTFTVVDAPQGEAAMAHSSHVLSIYGADKPGIVYRVADALSSRGVNITDLTSHPMGRGVYTVLLELDLPDSADFEEVEGALKEVAAELGVDFALRPSDTAEL